LPAVPTVSSKPQNRAPLPLSATGHLHYNRWVLFSVMENGKRKDIRDWDKEEWVAKWEGRGGRRGLGWQLKGDENINSRREDRKERKERKVWKD